MASVTHNVYDALRRRIASGKFRPGARVSETALAKELGTSRAPVREAIRDLVNEGFLERTPNAGAFVKSPDRNDLVELYEVREWVECGAIERAVKWIDAGQLDALEQACAELREVAYGYRDTGVGIGEGELGDRQEAAELAFHLGILRAAGNRRAISILASQHLLQRTWFVGQALPEWQDIERQVEEHLAVVEALRTRDGAAAQKILRQHIRKGCQLTLAAFDRQQRKLALDGYVLPEPGRVNSAWGAGLPHSHLGRKSRKEV